MDARTGKVIQAVNADTRVHPASLTKMMTLYIVFDQIRQGRLSLDQKITVSQNAADQPPSRLGLKAGQKIELRYLIRAAAIKSANDAATAMGDAIGGSEEGFAKMMNQYARAMGMTNTTFKNANGLTRPGHMSTARDMATLGRRLVYDFPQYYNIFGRTSTSAGIATVRNTNRRVLEAYKGADGIKTGYTKAAGFNVVSSAQRGDKRVIVAVLGGKSTASRNAEAERLMDVGFAKMPATARVVPPPPLRGDVVASAAVPKAVAVARAVPATPQIVVAEGDGSLAPVARPLPRSLDGDAISRNSATIAAAIAEVNAELTAAQATRNAPVPRDGPADAAALDRRPGGGSARRRLRLDLRGGGARGPAEPRRGGRAGGGRGGELRHHRRQRLGRAARHLPRQGRRRAAAADHRAQGRARALRRPPPGRGGQAAGRDRLPRPVRRPEPGRRARRLREPRADAGGLPAAGAGDLMRTSARDLARPPQRLSTGKKVASHFPATFQPLSSHGKSLKPLV